MSEVGTDLFKRIMQYADADDRADGRGNLMRKVWENFPWIVDAYTGRIANHGRYADIMGWCREQFGQEAFPIHGKPGLWHSGSATIDGYTWMGFSTEEMMEQFCREWETAVSEEATP